MEYSLGGIRASTFANREELLFVVLVLLTVVFTLIVGVMVITLALRYRRGSRVDRTRPVDHHLALELTWSIIPLILGLGVFVWGAKLFAEVRTPPADAEEIFVIGKRWMWHMQHMNGVRENAKLHVPLGKPIKLTMISQDVIHSIFIPSFRLHQDVIPGHYTATWFTATRVGTYGLFCSQYCGTAHSEMTATVYVMEPADYAVWLANGGDGPENRDEARRVTPEQAGGMLYEQLGCGNCHGAQDTVRGPSLISIAGKRRNFVAGGSGLADDQYLRESIVNPQAKLVKGYGATMPAYPVGNAAGKLSEEKVLSLIAYMKSLGPTSRDALPSTGTSGKTPQPNVNPDQARSMNGTVKGGVGPDRNSARGAAPAGGTR